MKKKIPGILARNKFRSRHWNKKKTWWRRTVCFKPWSNCGLSLNTRGCWKENTILHSADSLHSTTITLRTCKSLNRAGRYITDNNHICSLTLKWYNLIHNNNSVCLFLDSTLLCPLTSHWVTKRPNQGRRLAIPTLSGKETLTGWEKLGY